MMCTFPVLGPEYLEMDLDKCNFLLINPPTVINTVTGHVFDSSLLGMKTVIIINQDNKGRLPLSMAVTSCSHLLSAVSLLIST